MFDTGSAPTPEPRADSGSAESPGASPGGGGSGSKLQFREASAPSPTADSGGLVAQADSEAGQEGSFLQFRAAEGEESSFRHATGEESSSVQLVQPAPNAPGQKRARESDSEVEEVENVKKRRREDETDGDVQVATSEPVAITNEDEIDDAFADAFGEDEEDERERELEVEGKGGGGDKEDGLVGDSVTGVETADKRKVLSGGEIDDALAHAFVDNDGEDEPEDVALPTGTERDSAEENAANDAGHGAVKDRPQDGATKNSVKASAEKEMTGIADVRESKMLEEPIDEITPVHKGKGTELREVQPNAEQSVVGSDAMEIEPKAGAKAVQVDGAKDVAAPKEKKAAKNTAKGADAGENKDVKEVEADASNVAEKKLDSPVKGSAGDNAKDARPKGLPPAIDSEEEEAPLDLAAMSAFEYEQVAKLNPVQLRRYEQYRRSDLKNAKVKKVLVNLNPALQKASEQYIIAVKGLSKLFVGDVVECAIEVKKQMGEKGALQPKHLREAYRRLRRTGVIPSTTDKSASFS